MEITRQQLGNGDKGAFRAKQLNARRMLAGELENEDLDAYVEERLMTTTLEKAANWARGNAFMPATSSHRSAHSSFSTSTISAA